MRKAGATAAADTLLALIKRDRDWNEAAARKQLLQFFDAWGNMDPATVAARRKLSALALLLNADVKARLEPWASTNPYRGPDDLPNVIPVFPLLGRLAAAARRIAAQYFRAALSRDDRRCDEIASRHRHDPAGRTTAARYATPGLAPIGCAGRITQFAETGDGRYLITLTGIARFRHLEEIRGDDALSAMPHRFFGLSHAISRRARARTRSIATACCARLRDFAEANELQIDWDSIHEAPNEALVNALAMMSPYGPREKQALLEAPDLKTRAEVLVAITEYELARAKSDSSPLQ